MREDEQLNENADAILVNPEVLSAAIEAAARETSVEEFTFIETEPWLSTYCRAELLQTLGRLAVAGTTPAVVRGVAADIHRLVTVAAQAMRSGYGGLLEDFLPEFAAPTSESTARAVDDNEPGP